MTRTASGPKTAAVALLAAAGMVAMGYRLFFAQPEAPGHGAPHAGQEPSATVTFNEHVAPILFRHCAGCHRPGESGPFSLLTYEDASKRAGLIAAVTASRYMPPWLPAAGGPPFLGERRLSDRQIALLAQWAAEGAPEGAQIQPPPAPAFTRGWQLGEPDLVVEMPEPYALTPEGTDVFRNFAIPIPVTSTRWVKAVELRPGNPKVVHHGVIQIDGSRASRRRDEQDPGPGFGGMDLGAAENPGGQLLGWTPGKVPVDDPRMAWRLDPGTDLILQLHLQPSGKPERVRARVGLHFAQTPPTLHPFTLLLRNDQIDIPPEQSDYTVEDTLELPAPVDVLGVYPHAHFLGKDVRAFATLPDGTEKTLIHIPDWNFNWQDDYRYREPVHLPKGTVVTMRHTYDNSAANVRNPNNPPARVRFGNRSQDEMATLALQVLPAKPDDRPRLEEALMRARLARNSDNWYAHGRLGVALRSQGRHEQAITHFHRAIALNPDNAQSRYYLGNALGAMGELDQAITVYREALALEPDHPRANNNLGVAFQMKGEFSEAEIHFRRQIDSSPGSAKAHYNLGTALAAQQQLAAAAKAYRKALNLDPRSGLAMERLGDVLRLAQDLQGAESHYRRALEIDPESAHARYGLGLTQLEGGDLPAGLVALGEAMGRDDTYIEALNTLAWKLATSPDPGRRNPQTAVALAELVNEHTGGRRVEYLDTLGAAYGTAGDFQRAEATAARVLTLASESGSFQEYVNEFQERLQLYRQRKPYVSRSP